MVVWVQDVRLHREGDGLLVLDVELWVDRVQPTAQHAQHEGEACDEEEFRQDIRDAPVQPEGEAEEGLVVLPAVTDGYRCGYRCGYRRRSRRRPGSSAGARDQ